jgi:hypothetical protein
VTFASDVGIATLSTADPTGHSGWSSPVSLAPWLGKEWTSRATIPGPGVATAIVLPGGGERLLFVAHAGAYKQDVVFYSDDAGATFNVSASTPFNPAANVLKAMDEAAFAQLSNGSVLLVLRNLGGEGEAKRFPNGSRPPYHNPRCADNGICKAFSRSDDHGLTYARSTPSTAARAFRLLYGVLLPPTQFVVAMMCVVPVCVHIQFAVGERLSTLGMCAAARARQVCWTTTRAFTSQLGTLVSKNGLLERHLCIKTMFLPRQAREKHRESSITRPFFLRHPAQHRTNADDAPPIPRRGGELGRGDIVGCAEQRVLPTSFAQEQAGRDR